MRRGRVFALVAFGSAATLASVACIDLFHSTEFETSGEAGVAPDVAVGDAGNDAGPKPLVDFCKWGPAEARTNATRACAWLGACGGALDGTVFGPCMMQALWAYDCDLNPGLRPNGATYALWSCLSDVKSCGDVQSCLRPSGPPDLCPAIVGGSFTQCGDAGTTELRVECSETVAGPPSRFEPCALQGRTCIPLNASTSMCGGAARKTCPQGTACIGTGAVDCKVSDGTLADLGVDCAAFGAGACAEEDAGKDGGPVVGCVPLPSAPACDGGIAVTCDVEFPAIARSCVGGRSASVDCSKLGVACDTSKGVPSYQPLAACTENVDAGRCNTPDACESGKLRSCAQGIAFEADCAALGLGPCERINGGVIAHCAAP